MVQRPLLLRVAASGAMGLPPLISLNGLLLLVLLLVSHSSRRPRAWPSAMPACDSATNKQLQQRAASRRRPSRSRSGGQQRRHHGSAGDGSSSASASSMLRGAAGARWIREAPIDQLPPVSERWQDGRYGAREVMAQSLEKWPRALEAPASCWLEIPLQLLLERTEEVARREAGVGGRCYIGSTSDPAWRWEGGWYIVSPGDDERRQRCAEGGDEWAWMDGHRLKWRRMAVLGSWRDKDTAACEAAAIAATLAALPPNTLTNRCADARGLSIRAHAYSFVYICFDQVMPVFAKRRGRR